MRTGVVTFLIGAGLLAASVAAFGEQRMISIGDRRLSVYCDGKSSLPRGIASGESFSGTSRSTRRMGSFGSLKRVDTLPGRSI